MSKLILHTAESRGTTNQGWLHSRHTFSFGDYYNKERIHFGELRVINDDMLAPGKGFGMHPHSNMEIITIPLEGELEYKDDLNNTATIGKGEVQVISGGTGIFHSEGNRNKDKSVRFIQMWIVPKIQKVKPRNAHGTYELINNDITEIVSPALSNNSLWIYQDAWVFIAKGDSNYTFSYKLKKPEGNGVYFFILQGEVLIEEQLLKARDGLGIWETAEITIELKADSEFLIIEVPMKA